MAHVIDQGPTEHREGLAEAEPVPATVHTEEMVQGPAGVERHERVVVGSGVEHREQNVRDVAGEQNMMLMRLTQLMWLVIGVIEVAIGLRVVLKVIGANPSNDFANFVYSFAGVFLGPFFGLTGSPATGGLVLEVPSIIAMLVYALLGWGLVRLIGLFFTRSTTSTSTYDRYRG